jgi:UPF0755 protein
VEFVLKRLLKIVSILIGVLLLMGAAGAGWLFFWPLMPGQDRQEIDFRVKWGSSLYNISQNLEKQGIVQSAENFVMVTKLLGRSDAFKAGLFRLKTSSSNYSVLKALQQGAQSYIKVTIPEGLPAKKIAAIVQNKLDLDSMAFMHLVSDTEFIQELGLQTPQLEGYLFPETYNLPYGIDERQVIETMVDLFKEELPDSFETRASRAGFTLNQIITLASIIQAEAILDDEMPLISSVFHNRLKKGMLLQADPTIQYIIPDGPRRLLNRDLEIDSPYNTYQHPGLPPTPINNPCRKAILAALEPADTGYLYFVANGDGSHTFSVTLQQHLNAKRKLDEIRKSIAREKRRNG